MKKPIINQQAVLTEEEGEAILFDPDSLVTVWLNETALFIWKDLSKGCSKQQILQHFRSVYEDIEDNNIEDDPLSEIESFIQKLKQSGFLI